MLVLHDRIISLGDENDLWGFFSIWGVLYIICALSMMFNSNLNWFLDILVSVPISFILVNIHIIIVFMFYLLGFQVKLLQTQFYQK